MKPGMNMSLTKGEYGEGGQIQIHSTNVKYQEGEMIPEWQGMVVVLHDRFEAPLFQGPWSQPVSLVFSD